MIKVYVVSIYREIIWFRAGTTVFDNFGLSFFWKRFGMHRYCLKLHYEHMRFKQANDVTL